MESSATLMAVLHIELEILSYSKKPTNKFQGEI
jgi:hypothetical protein